VYCKGRQRNPTIWGRRIYSMREIKFRAWDKPINRWYSPVYEAHKGLLEELNIGISGRLSLRTMSGTADESTFKDRFIIMQYTGLKDSEGREVYEGDILRFTYWWFDGNEAETPLIGEVTYIQEEASYGLTHIKNAEWIKHIGGEEGDKDTQSFSGWQFSSDDIQILGNIYKNPELLEPKS
jgi:uncharacterized phage protein (TIGR01671 family)